MVRTWSCAVALLLLVVSPEASAQLVLAPPVLGPELKPPVSAIERAIQEELEKMGIEPLKRTKRTTARLVKCGNKMSCLSTVGKQLNAAHVLHTIVAQRGEEVLAQLTILDVHTKKPLDVARAKTTTTLDAIDRSIRGAAHMAGITLKKLPQYADDTIAMEPVKPTPPTETTPTPAIGAAPVETGTPPIGKGAPATAPAVEESFGPSARAQEKKPPELIAETAPPPIETTVTSPPVDEPSKGLPGFLKWGAGGIGIAAATGGVIALSLASSDAGKRDETPQIDQAGRQALHDSAVTKQNIGLGLLIGGGVAITASVVMLLWDAGRTSTAMLEPAPSGLAFDW